MTAHALTHRAPRPCSRRVELARWDKRLPASPTNLVLVSSAEADMLDEQGQQALEPAVVASISQRLKDMGSWGQ